MDEVSQPKVTRTDEAVEVVVEGEVDVTGGPRLASVLMDAIESAGGTVIIDLTDARLTDKSAGQIIRYAVRWADQRDVEVRLVPASPEVQELLSNGPDHNDGSGEGDPNDR